jgi:hypothetical protein
LEHLGSEEAIETMFTYIGETFLSTGYKETRDWTAFLEKEAPGGIPGWAGERSKQGRAKQAVDSFLKDYMQTEGKLLAAMALPGSLGELEQMTPYALAVHLYDRWQSAEEITAAICERTGVDSDSVREKMVSFFVKAILYRFNVRFVPEYRPLFVLDS